MKSPSVVEITESNFEAEVAESEQPVLLDFWAEWCPPCHAMDRHVVALAEDFRGRVRVAACDTESSPELAARFGVRSIPTFLVLQSGQVVGQVIGAVPRARLDALVQQALDAAAAA